MVQALSPGHLFATQWTVAPQAPLSMGFSRQEYWSRLPFPPPGDRPNPGIEPSRSLTSPALAGGFFTTAPHGSQLKGRPRLGFCPRRWLPVSPPRFSLYTICLIVIASSLSFFFFFFNYVEVFALPLGVFRFRRLFDLEPWAFLFFITVGTALPSSSHIRVI